MKFENEKEEFLYWSKKCEFEKHNGNEEEAKRCYKKAMTLLERIKEMEKKVNKRSN